MPVFTAEPEIVETGMEQDCVLQGIMADFEPVPDTENDRVPDQPLEGASTPGGTMEAGNPVENDDNSAKKDKETPPPRHYKEVYSYSMCDAFVHAMKVELDGLKAKETYQIVPIPTDRAVYFAAVAERYRLTHRTPVWTPGTVEDLKPNEGQASPSDIHLYQ
ncbi:hypothetical protein N7490_012272 [Penicillium lividum]|nr:hypothetical protein N7490_012272 [Penicillium lividum]